MAVGYQRPRTPFFTPGALLPPQQQSPYLSFLDIAGGGVGGGAEVAEAQPAPEQSPQLVEPIAPPEQTQGDEQGQDKGGDVPSEASIARRMKLAQAMMGEQMEVHHPMQALANAVNKIAGTWMENKAQSQQEEGEKRRRGALKSALGGGGDLNAMADNMLQSDDPKIVDQGLEIKLKLAMAGPRKPGAPRQMIKGDQVVYVDPNTGEEVPGYGGPRFRDRAPGGSGGPGGPGGPARSQKGYWVRLPDGTKVYAEYIPNKGLIYRDEAGAIKSLPQGTQPITATQGGYLTPQQYLKLKEKRAEAQNALDGIEQYAKGIGGLNPGFQRWGNEMGARFKTFLGQQGLSEQQFRQLSLQAQQQALLGMLRTTIVGPGVMTEYDAIRVIQAMGGNPASAIQNPSVVIPILQNLYKRKRREAQVWQDELERNASTYGQDAEPLGAPDTLEVPGYGPPPQQRTAPANIPPKEKRVKGQVYDTPRGKMKWTGTGWVPA